MRSTQSRRRFLQLTTLGAAVSLSGVPGTTARPAHAATTPSRGTKLKLGLASYSLRKFDVDQTLAMAKRVGLKYIALKDFHLPLDSSPGHIEEVGRKVKQAGLVLYGGGVIYMKNEANVLHAFEYAKIAGMTTIIGVPAHNQLPLVDHLVKQYNIKLAIHNHGPGDKVYPTPEAAYEKIKHLDRRIGLCNDIGHTRRSGVDPSFSLEKYADRLLDVHVKDVSAATAKGHGVEVGRGVIDIPKVLRTLVKIDYTGVVSFEYEKNADDPMPGLAESVGYVRGVLACL